jgi:hypothetical protein
MPADGSRGPRLDASDASAVAASGGSGVTWITTRSVSTSARAISRRLRASGPNHSGTIAITLPPALIPELSASTSSPDCSAVGGSGTASIRPSAPTIRSGLSPKATITGAARAAAGGGGAGAKFLECSSSRAGTEPQ